MRLFDWDIFNKLTIHRQRMSKILNGSSPVTCMNGCVASSQCLASAVGVDVLKAGGNAADASVAMAAVLNVVEPYSTGKFYQYCTKVHGDS